MSKKEKLKAWYEKHKREIRDAAWYMAGAAMAIGGIYVANRLDEMKYDGYNVKTSLMEKFGGELTFIKPYFFADEGEEYQIWADAMHDDEMAYLYLIDMGRTPQEARSVLPNSIKTEVVMTANYREWRHFFNLRACRATGPAHPQMEEITVPLLLELNDRIPVIFEDLKCKVENHISA